MDPLKWVWIGSKWVKSGPVIGQPDPFVALFGSDYLALRLHPRVICSYAMCKGQVISLEYGTFLLPTFGYFLVQKLPTSTLFVIIQDGWHPKKST